MFESFGSNPDSELWEEYRYRDRTDAGRRLARELESRGISGDALVLALPRGGVPVAFEVAHALALDMDLILVRKLGAPMQPELAMGALADGGVRVLNDDVIALARITEEEIEAKVAKEQAELERRSRAYREDREPPDVQGRMVVLVDDGIATGATLLAAIRAVQARGARHILVAVPVASSDVLMRVAGEADEVVCPLTPTDLAAIGLWYDHFEQLTDDDVRDYMRRAAAERGGRGEPGGDSPERAAEEPKGNEAG